MNNGNNGRVSEVCSILLVKSPERLQLRRFNVLLVKLKVFHTFFVCFSCWLRTGKCLLGYRRPLVNFENSQRLQSSKVPAYSCLWSVCCCLWLACSCLWLVSSPLWLVCICLWRICSFTNDLFIQFLSFISYLFGDVQKWSQNLAKVMKNTSDGVLLKKIRRMQLN